MKAAVPPSPANLGFPMFEVREAEPMSLSFSILGASGLIAEWAAEKLPSSSFFAWVRSLS